MNSYYRCEAVSRHDGVRRHVTVWPCITGESGFFDVVFGEVGNLESNRTVTRLTAFESAGYVLTELGVPHGETLNSLSGMIERWRAGLDAQQHEARVAAALSRIRETL